MKEREIALSPEWRVFMAAETVLFASRHYLRKRDDFMGNMLAAMDMMPEQGSALRLMMYESFSDSELEILAPVVIDIAVNGSVDNICIARDVLSKYRNKNVIKTSLNNVVDKYLLSPDDWVYRRLAELLTEVGFRGALEKLMLICKNSDNDNIFEIYKDFASIKTW